MIFHIVPLALVMAALIVVFAVRLRHHIIMGPSDITYSRVVPVTEAADPTRRTATTPRASNHQHPRSGWTPRREPRHDSEIRDALSIQSACAPHPISVHSISKIRGLPADRGHRRSKTCLRTRSLR